MTGTKIKIAMNTEDFYGKNSAMMTPVQIDDIAYYTKGLIVGVHNEEIESMKIELFVALIPTMKKNIGLMSIDKNCFDEALSLSWDVFDYLFNKWEIKYYNGNVKVANAKRNSFYGYFVTFYKGMLNDKWFYSRNVNEGGIIKRSKHTDLKDDRIALSCGFIDDEEENVVDMASNYSIDMLGFELKDYIERNYELRWRKVILYLMGKVYGNMVELQSGLGYSRRETEQFVKEVKERVGKDEELISILLEASK